MPKTQIVPKEHIASKIYFIRNSVETKQLTRQVRRNISRFPEDFMFELTKEEYDSLRCQIGTLKGRGKYSKYLPLAFTEQGVAMLSSVLRSKRANEIFEAIKMIIIQEEEPREKIGFK